AFFRRELEAERSSGWSRLQRIPDTQVKQNLRYYDSLTAADREAFLGCLAGMASVTFSFVLDLPAGDHAAHPFFNRWRQAMLGPFPKEFYGVPHLRAAVAQYKIY